MWPPSSDRTPSGNTHLGKGKCGRKTFQKQLQNTLRESWEGVYFAILVKMRLNLKLKSFLRLNYLHSCFIKMKHECSRINVKSSKSTFQRMEL